MKWPLPQDFNEAVQNPGVAFADPDLRAGTPTVGPTGVPLPHSGNFADVYQVRGPDGRPWAVKCFTRPVFGLAVRYARIAEELARAQFKFTVGFTFQAEGIRVRGEWRPVIKMEWVEGRPLNQVVEDHLASRKVLGGLAHRWGRLCKKLREAGVAHGDIQHGNVLLVPGSKPGSYGLTLVDYDGMYVPELAGVPSGEAGHPNFQHPERVATRAYSADLDRFPHLAVVTALTALAGGGRDLWDRYDNGDNLLFTDRDFRDPAGSRVMRELWQTGGPAVRALVGRLAVACRRPLALTPWVDEVAPEGEVVPLDPDTEREAVDLLGPVGSAPAGWAADEPGFEVEDDPDPGPAAPAFEAVSDPEPAAPRYEEVPAEPEYEESEYDEPGYEEREYEDRRPRKAARRPAERPRRPARRRRRSATPFLLVGVVLLAVGAAGGAVAFVVSKSRGPVDDHTGPRIVPPDSRPVIPGLDPRPVITNPDPTPGDPSVPRPPLSNPIIPPGGAGPDEPVDPAALPRLKVRWERPAGRITMSRLAITSDGGRIVAAGYGQRELAVIDTRTGNVARPFTGHDGPVVGVAPLSNGQILSLAQNRNFALVWDPATGQQLGQVPGVPITRQAEPFVYTTPNGKYLLAGGTESDSWQPAPQSPSGATVMEIATGKNFAVPMRWGVARFTSDSARLVVAHDKNPRIEYFELTTGKPFRTVAEGSIEPALVIAISPDGRHVVYLGNVDRPDLKRYHVYDGTGRRVRTIPLRPTAGFRTGFSPNGQWLLLVHSAAGGSEAVLVETTTWTPVAVAAAGNTRGIQWDHGHRFSPDGSTLVVPKAGGGLIAFDVPPDVDAARKLGTRP